MMLGNERPTAQVVWVTPELAAKWLAANINNRVQRPDRIKLFARDMVNGHWRITNDAIAFDWNGHLKNGQHRLLAVIVSGQAVEMLVITGLDPASAEVMDAGSRRTVADFLRAERNYTDAGAVAAVARIGLARENGFFQNSLDTVMPLYSNIEVREWADTAPGLDRAVREGRRLYVAIGSHSRMAALIYATWAIQRIAPDSDFFDSIIDSRTTGNGDPRLALTRALIRKGSAVRIGEAIYLMFRAWNGYVTGERTAGYPTVSRSGAIPIPELRTPPTARLPEE